MEQHTCQSCGMPINSEENFGINIDGTKNEDYCHYCFRDGKFTDEGISMHDKIKKNIKMAVKRGISEEQAKETANRVIPNLKRWQDIDKY